MPHVPAEDFTAERIRAEINKLMAETIKLGAETAKLNAEAEKMTRERYWYPALIIASAVGAGVAIAKLVF